MKVHVVSPWYPDYAAVFLGVFVEKQVNALLARGLHVTVEVPQVFPAPAGPLPPEVSEEIERLAQNDHGAFYPKQGFTTWIPTPVATRSGYAGRITAFEKSLAQKRRHLPVTADVTHAHLGVPTGAALAHLNEQPLVITEHQSTLDQVLSEPRARAGYLEAINHSDASLVVSSPLRDRLEDEFGSAITTPIEVMPNIVDLGNISFRDRRKGPCANWAYVGAVIAKKGIRLLVESFIRYRRRHDPDATLTIVGDGDQREWVLQKCRSAGFPEAVSIVGSIPHDQINRYLAAADVLVHLSPAETFGIASLEALGAGLPVVSLRNGGAEDTWGAIEDISGTLLSPLSNADQVASAVAELSGSAERLDLAAARDFVEQSYSPMAVGSKLEAVYRRVLP